MNILVSGGAGFIGSNLVDCLIDQGHQVTVIDDLSSGLEEYLNQQAEFHRLDINDSKVGEIFSKNKFELVYHLAAQIDVRQSVADPLFDNKVNIIGGLNILENCRQQKVKKIIFTSTGGAIYGENESIPTKEEAATYPLSPYGINKLAFEKYLYYYHQEYGLDYSSLRLANVYGPRQFKGGEAGVVAIFSDQAVKGGACTIFGDGRQTRDFVYVDDVVEALIAAGKPGCQGEVNIGTSLETDLWQVVAGLEKALGQKIKTVTAPAKAGEQRRSALDVNKAKQVLDWQAKINLETGLKNTITWTKDKLKK